MAFRFPIHPSPAVRGVFSALLIAVLAGGLMPGRVDAASVTLRPGKDTTIYGNGDANLSNGAGAFLFAGNSGQKRVLRSLVAFNLAGQIPAGATINSVSLTFGVSTPLAVNSNTVRLHRVLADWGEGDSLAPMGGGGGAAATSGGATWNARLFGTANWSTPGGDFSPTVSASQTVRGTSGTVAFSSAGMVADVQAWVNAPAANFGWIMVGQDEASPTSAVRFASREGSPAPSLVVDFTASSVGANAAPVFTSQPASQAVSAGATVTIS
ncbi:MAG: hypothetical protein EXS37_21820, partial [Opitutus sp.]|nr:hypothetical protein [Opitutus sp.]